jgi:hypothetical protein
MGERYLTRYITYDADCPEAEWERDFREYEELSMGRPKKNDNDKQPKITPAPLPKEKSWVIRRDMPRTPKDGKR